MAATNRHRELNAQRAQLADLVGQQVIGAELLPDGSALGLRFEVGELVILATLRQQPDGRAPALLVDWQIAPNRSWDERARAISCASNPAASGSVR